MAAGHIFQNNRPAYFLKMAAECFVLMGPTWTRDMTSVYLGLDLEKDRIFLCFFNSKKKAGGDAKHVFFFTSPNGQMGTETFTLIWQVVLK